MKTYMSALLFAFLMPLQGFSQPIWAQVAPGTYMSQLGPQDALQAIYLYPDATQTTPPNVWRKVTLSSLPVGAKAIALSGIMIITTPSPISVGIYGGTLALRKAGTIVESNYNIQSSAVNFTGWTPSIGYFWVGPGNGARTPGFAVVALNSNREFEFKYTIQNVVGGSELVPGLGFGINFCVPMWWGLPDLYPYSN